MSAVAAWSLASSVGSDRLVLLPIRHCDRAVSALRSRNASHPCRRRTQSAVTKVLAWKPAPKGRVTPFTTVTTCDDWPGSCYDTVSRNR